eukprot:Seg272.1 transcript_id=Seg272.1/GoldUCD/mRNA.D3Y31 product="hypothetical protein" protein_id=Seg272.1/GoldUCD/D3Y31
MTSATLSLLILAHKLNPIGLNLRNSNLGSACNISIYISKLISQLFLLVKEGSLLLLDLRSSCSFSWI